jgi:hypothetical protein
MRQTIAIGNKGLDQIPNRAAAHAVVESAPVLRDDLASVAVSTRAARIPPHVPRGCAAATPAPTAVVRPVAMVFRLLMAHAPSDSTSDASIGGAHVTHPAAVLTPFPTTEPYNLPGNVRAALPVPVPLA